MLSQQRFSSEQLASGCHAEPLKQTVLPLRVNSRRSAVQEDLSPGPPALSVRRLIQHRYTCTLIQADVVHLLFLEPSRMAPGSSQSHVQPFILLSWLPVSQTLSLFISSRFALLHTSAVLSARLSAYSSSDRLFTWKQFKSKFTGKNLICAPCPMAWWLNEKSFVQLWARTLWAVSDAVFVISCFPQMRSKRHTRPFSPLHPWLKQISRDSDMSAVSNSTQ